MTTTLFTIVEPKNTLLSSCKRFGLIVIGECYQTKKTAESENNNTTKTCLFTPRIDVKKRIV
jgi:hypothetical protein